MSGLLQSSQDFIELNRVAEFTCSEPWLNKLRRRGLKSFSTNGLPTPNIEEWKYTNLKKCLEQNSFNVEIVNNHLEKVKTNL